MSASLSMALARFRALACGPAARHRRQAARIERIAAFRFSYGMQWGDQPITRRQASRMLNKMDRSAIA